MTTRSTTRTAPPARTKAGGRSGAPAPPVDADDVYELPEELDNDLIDIEDDRAVQQAAWVAVYQRALADAGGEPRAVGPDGRAALDALVRDVIPLVQKVAVSEVEKRFGTARPGTVVEDCHAAGLVEVITLAAEFDAGRGVAFHRAVSAKYGKVRAAMRDLVDAANGVGPLPSKEHRRVARTARWVRSEHLKRTGEEPGGAELQELVLQHYRAQAPDRLPDLSPEEAVKAADARLTRSGMRAAIHELDTLLTMTSAQRMPDGEEAGWTGLADELGEAGRISRPDDRVLAAADTAELTSFERVATGNLTTIQREAVVARLVGRDEPGAPEGPWTYAAITDRYRIPTGDVRELVKTARARLAAPHAQFAHLAPGLDAQFETAPATTTAAAAMGRRIGRTVRRAD